jgi:hypothetical protein
MCCGDVESLIGLLPSVPGASREASLAGDFTLGNRREVGLLQLLPCGSDGAFHLAQFQAARRTIQGECLSCLVLVARLGEHQDKFLCFLIAGVTA